MLTVYILYSETLGKHYTGQTNDIENRLSQHNSGKSKYTQKGVPWRMIWSREVSDRTEAVNLEKTIKKRGAKRFLEDLRGVA